MQLIVEIPTQGDIWRYLTLNDAQAVVRHDTTTLSLLPRSGRVVAVVPASQISWHRVTLPKSPGSRTRAALEGILEERLLDEPSTMHFAIHQLGGGQEFWVAACNKSWLQSALRALQTAGLSAGRVIAEAEPSSQWTAHAISGECGAQLLVCGPDGVAVWPMPESNTVSADWLTSLGARVSEPFTAEPQVAVALESMTDAPVHVRTRVERLAQLVQPGASSVELAQFDLKALTGSGWQQKALNGLLAVWGAPQWRAVRIGLVGLAFVNLVGLNAMAFKQTEILNAKKGQIESVLKQAFPSTSVVLDAPLQMQQQLLQLKQRQGGLSERDFESLLGTFSAVVQSSSAPTAIEFDSKELKVTGLQVPPEELGRSSQQLAARGLGLRIDGAALILGVATKNDSRAPSGAMREVSP